MLYVVIGIATVRWFQWVPATYIFIKKYKKKITIQSTLFVLTLNTTTKFIIMTIWPSQNLRLEGNNWSQILQEYCISYFKNICFGYLLELPQRGNSNKYPKHMYYEKTRKKIDLSYISIRSLRILYNSKFILMAMSFETNAVVVMKGHCMFWQNKHLINSNEKVRKLRHFNQHVNTLQTNVYSFVQVKTKTLKEELSLDTIPIRHRQSQHKT